MVAGQRVLAIQALYFNAPTTTTLYYRPKILTPEALSSCLDNKYMVNALWSEDIIDAGSLCREFEAHIRDSGVLKTGTFQAAVLTD